METEHELLHNCTLFQHVESQSDTYNGAYKKAVTFNTCEGWARLFNNIPDAGTLTSSTHEIRCHDEKVIAYSIFRDDIKPEWEDKRNETGCEWECRQELERGYVTEMWKLIVASMCGGELDILGSRVVNKNTSFQNVSKVEIWLGEEHDPAEVYGKLQEILSSLKFPSCIVPNFQLVHHDIRNKETSDFNEKRRRKKNRYEKYKVKDFYNFQF